MVRKRNEGVCRDGRRRFQKSLWQIAHTVGYYDMYGMVCMYVCVLMCSVVSYKFRPSSSVFSSSVNNITM